MRLIDYESLRPLKGVNYSKFRFGDLRNGNYSPNASR
jgi:hypothetical protein